MGNFGSLKCSAQINGFGASQLSENKNVRLKISVNSPEKNVYPLCDIRKRGCKTFVNVESIELNSLTLIYFILQPVLANSPS